VRNKTDTRTPTLVDLFRSRQSSSSQSEVRPLILRRYREGFGGGWSLFLRFHGEEQELEKRNQVMYKRFIVLLGMFLGSHAPAAARTPAPQMVLAQERVAPTMTMLRTVSAPLPAASFQMHQDPVKSPAHFSSLVVGAYERDHNMERLPPTEEVKTLFFTRSSLPLAQLWRGRLRLDGFTGTLNMQNVQLGPSASGGLQDFRPPRQSYPGGPHSVDLYGVSLNFHFGRNARTGRPTQVWRCLSRIVGAVLN